MLNKMMGLFIVVGFFCSFFLFAVQKTTLQYTTPYCGLCEGDELWSMTSYV